MGRYGVKEQNAESRCLQKDFAERMEISVVNTYFKKRGSTGRPIRVEEDLHR